MNILHKLGLYKKSEIDELIAKTAALTNSVDGVIEEAKIHRACFKAAIGMVNDVNHAVKVISKHCASTMCYDCGFTAAGKRCKLAYTPPAWWNLLEVSK